MAGIDYTMDGVIADVKRGGAIPTHQSLFDEDDFVSVLSDEMKTVLVPLIMSVQENHFQTYEDQTIVEGQDNYPVPWRAIGNKLKSVQVWDGTDRLATLPRLDLRDNAADEFSGLEGFRMEGVDVVLVPSDTWVGKTLRLYYFRRPNDLIPVTDSGKVTAIDTVTGEVTLDAVPTDWTTSTTFDCITNKPPFKATGEELTINAINSLILTFDSVPTGLAVGDYVAPKGTSPIPQIPYDAFPLLAARGVSSVLGSLSPQQGAAADKTYANLHAMYLQIIAPRIDDAPKKLVNRKGIWQSGGNGRWHS